MTAPTPLVDALLFDFGNIVVDIDFHRAFEAWARAAGIPAAAIARRFAFDPAYEAHELGEMEAAQYHAHLCGRLAVNLSFDDFLAGWNAIFVQPRDGMERLLPALAASMPLYLYSNTNAAHHAYWSAEYRSLLENFSGIFCSHEIGARKPAPAAFTKVAGKMRVSPSRIAFFDDLPENVQGARLAGLAAFHITSVPDLRKALVSLQIPAPPQL
ncbi:MAG: HAD family hydrolase [Betaproteobacteria bacterium]